MPTVTKKPIKLSVVYNTNMAADIVQYTKALECGDRYLKNVCLIKIHNFNLKHV